MKLLLTILILIFSADLCLSQVYVRGYFRSDGTYVKSHYRSSPDGNFYNNWSTKGNVNPYTGKPGTKVTPPNSYKSYNYDYLKSYYQENKSFNNSSTRTYSSFSSSRSYASEDFGDEIDDFPVLPGNIAEDDLDRSKAYCSRLYGYDQAGERKCMERQSNTLASITLPDYSQFEDKDLKRSAYYCERLYDDDRAGFYNCLNRQIFNLSSDVNFGSSIPTEEVNRSKQYCERLYANDRGGYTNCIDRQSTKLSTYYFTKTSDLDKSEWNRSVIYCENLYDNDRGGVASCKARQAKKIRYYQTIGLLKKNLKSKPKVYCGRLYDNDRAGYWGCIARQIRQ